MVLTARGLWRLLRRHWLTFGFGLGFITDLVLLNRVDDLVDNLILFFYVTLATTSLLFLYVGVSERVPGAFAQGLRKYSPILMQYAFGGLLSGMLIFYGRSGDWIASAPYLILIVSVIIGNELMSKKSDRLVYYIALYFIGLFSYVVLVVPVLTGKMGEWVFVISGLIALVLVTFVVQILYRIVPNFMAINTQRIILTIGSVYIMFNALYFTNIIPPIPLSLIELELVQSVSKLSDGSYRVVSESQPWYRRILFIRTVLHPTRDTVACFARIYAPMRLSTEIVHRWEYRDDNGDWQEHFLLGYEISGANQGGYRGYTEISNFKDGVWRCSVETKRGQVLGREVVYIDTSGVPYGLTTYIE